MNFDNLNKMVNYIEKNLESEINYDDLAKITNTNLFILERIFMFLTNMTIKEYIKKRRLSKAFEEIKNTDQKIIDIAFKYQFNSATSFNRAFKQLFNITPTGCRYGEDNYKIIPIQYFENNNINYNFDYEIKDLKDKVIYCYHIDSDNYNDFLFRIKTLYKTLKNDNTYYEFQKVGMYGVFMQINNTYHYLLGSEKKIEGLEEYKIQGGKYALFVLPSREQKNIAELEVRINKQWLPSTNYNIKNMAIIEYYKDNMCYIYLKLN